MAAPREKRNQDLSAAVTHVGSESLPQTVQYEEQSNAPAYWENAVGRQASHPHITGHQKPPKSLNKTEAHISSQRLVISPTEEEFADVGYHDQQAQQKQIRSVPERYLPPEMLQELFFDCIESLLKTKRSESARRNDSLSNRYKRPQSHGHRAKDGLMKSSTSVTEVLASKRAFEKTSDKDKQQVLLEFIQNKAVLQSLYDAMFNDKNHRQVNNMASGLDLTSLLAHQNRDAQLLQNMPSQYRWMERKRNLGGVRSAGTLRGTRRVGNSLDGPKQGAESALRQEAGYESLNVVVDFNNDKLRS